MIIPVLVDETRDNIHPIVDEIVSRRNCPVYFTTGKKDEHRLDNKYCFYHIVEFLLNVGLVSNLSKLFQPIDC